MDILGWEQHYREGKRGREDHPTILLVETEARLNSGTAIDLACGTGRNALFLAEKGWAVTAIDGSETAIATAKQRAASHGLPVKAEVADLTAPDFQIPYGQFDLIVIAYYLQRDLIEQAKNAVKASGVILAIAHTPEPGEEWTPKRAKPGELRSFFTGWELLHDYEGASRDPAHRRPVAEIVARRPDMT